MSRLPEIKRRYTLTGHLWLVLRYLHIRPKYFLFWPWHVSDEYQDNLWVRADHVFPKSWPEKKRKELERKARDRAKRLGLDVAKKPVPLP